MLGSAQYVGVGAFAKRSCIASPRAKAARLAHQARSSGLRRLNPLFVELGVVFEPARAELVASVTQRFAPIPQLSQPDGSYTNW
jgi:hypothetical protein